MIKCYGLFWHADKVFWGYQNNQGCLKGIKKGDREKIVDFSTQRGIYALYADYDLVYVGQTGSGNDRLLKRLRKHRSDHLAERWNRFSWFGTQWVTQKGTLSSDTDKMYAKTNVSLNILEAIVIAISEPRLNLQRGRWTETDQYFQHSEDD